MSKLQSILQSIEVIAMTAGQVLGGPLGTDLELGAVLIDTINKIIPHAKAAAVPISTPVTPVPPTVAAPAPTPVQ